MATAQHAAERNWEAIPAGRRISTAEASVAEISVRIDKMAPATSDPDHVHLLADAKQKTHIRKILTTRGLASYMNDTKCRELCRGIDMLPFPPAYQIKRVDSNAPEPLELPYAPVYFGDWARPPKRASASTS